MGILWDCGNHWVPLLSECREYLLGKAHCLYDAAVFSAILCYRYYDLNHLNIVTNEHQQWHFYHLSSISALQTSALCHQFSYPIFFFINVSMVQVWSKKSYLAHRNIYYGCKIGCSVPGIQIDILLCCVFLFTAVASAKVEDVRPVLDYYSQFEDPMQKFRENQAELLVRSGNMREIRRSQSACTVMIV